LKHGDPTPSSIDLALSLVAASGKTTKNFYETSFSIALLSPQLVRRRPSFHHQVRS
jgi:hypothetical protein